MYIEHSYYQNYGLLIDSIFFHDETNNGSINNLFRLISFTILLTIVIFTVDYHSFYLLDEFYSSSEWYNSGINRFPFILIMLFPSDKLTSFRFTIFILILFLPHPIFCVLNWLPNLSSQDLCLITF